MDASDPVRPSKNSCGTGAVHIWVPAFAGTTMLENRRHTSAFPRHTFARVMQIIRPKGRGECRAPSAPAASRAKKAHELVTTGPPEITRHSRTQWFTAYIVLSPELGSNAHISERVVRRTGKRESFQCSRSPFASNAFSSEGHLSD